MRRIPAWFAIGEILVAGFVVLSIFSIVLYAPLWMIGGLACLIHQSWDSREKDGKRGSMGGGLVLGGSFVGEDGFEDVSRGRI
jgi:hypothetical protein